MRSICFFIKFNRESFKDIQVVGFIIYLIIWICAPDENHMNLPNTGSPEGN